MADEDQKAPEAAPREHRPPRGSRTEHTFASARGELRYTAIAEWAVLRKRDEAIAEIFHTAYLADGGGAADRPLTFVFNGGPGAASAYLHVGCVGPLRVAFDAKGGVLPPPAELVANAESWLAFTDLVFIDPVGTGLSRAVHASGQGAGAPVAGASSEKSAESEVERREKEFFALGRDLESLCEFIERFLSSHGRWTSPIFIAGESYGGFRVAKLARALQQGHGVGLNGAILISPALEWILLHPSDYDILYWSNVFPSMAATARHHGRSRAPEPEAGATDAWQEGAERFATDALVLYLAQGEMLPADARAETVRRAADYLGVDSAWIERCAGRVRPASFCRELLRSERRVCGLYDATLSAIDAFPDRDRHEGPDPTLFSIERAFAAGINALLRTTLVLDTDRTYRLLSFDVNRAWKIDTPAHVFERQVGATDDLRYAMSLNPHMHVHICHGMYDLVTPYFASKRIVAHMKLDPEQRDRMTQSTYEGGHMFYTWDTSRAAFTEAIESFVTRAMGRDARA